MAPPRILTIVLAGGAGGRLELLTERRAKPAVPFGGMYRLVDFPMTNARHSGFQDVWLVEQFHPVSVQDHLANGRPWDLDRTKGGLEVLHPGLAGDREGWHQGTADALWRQEPLIRDFAPHAIVVLSADAVYTLDYDTVVKQHRAAGAGVTMVTTRVDPDNAGRYGVIRIGTANQITGYDYKPDEPASDVVTTEVFVFEPTVLLDVLVELANAAGEDGLSDLGDGVLPRLVEMRTAREHRLDGYWRDVGTVSAYLTAHQDLVSADPPIRLDDPGWPLLTQPHQGAAARLDRGCEVSDSLVSPGCRVGGRVERSVLGPGVVVEPGAVVTDSVLLHDAVVRSGARLDRAIVDVRAEIGVDAVLGTEPKDRSAGGEGGDGIVLVAGDVRVAKGSDIPRGARVDAEAARAWAGARA